MPKIGHASVLAKKYGQSFARDFLQRSELNGFYSERIRDDTAFTTNVLTEFTKVPFLGDAIVYGADKLVFNNKVSEGARLQKIEKFYSGNNADTIYMQLGGKRVYTPAFEREIEIQKDLLGSGSRRASIEKNMSLHSPSFDLFPEDTRQKIVDDEVDRRAVRSATARRYGISERQVDLMIDRGLDPSKKSERNTLATEITNEIKSFKYSDEVAADLQNNVLDGMLNIAWLNSHNSNLAWFLKNTASLTEADFDKFTKAAVVGLEDDVQALEQLNLKRERLGEDDRSTIEDEIANRKAILQKKIDAAAKNMILMQKKEAEQRIAQQDQDLQDEIQRKREYEKRKKQRKAAAATLQAFATWNEVLGGDEGVGKYLNAAQHGLSVFGALDDMTNISGGFNMENFTAFMSGMNTIGLGIGAINALSSSGETSPEIQMLQQLIEMVGVVLENQQKILEGINELKSGQALMLFQIQELLFETRLLSKDSSENFRTVLNQAFDSDLQSDQNAIAEADRDLLQNEKIALGQFRNVIANLHHNNYRTVELKQFDFNEARKGFQALATEVSELSVPKFGKIILLARGDGGAETQGGKTYQDLVMSENAPYPGKWHKILAHRRLHQKLVQLPEIFEKLCKLKNQCSAFERVPDPRALSEHILLFLNANYLFALDQTEKKFLLSKTDNLRNALTDAAQLVVDASDKALSFEQEAKENLLSALSDVRSSLQDLDRVAIASTLGIPKDFPKNNKGEKNICEQLIVATGEGKLSGPNQNLTVSLFARNFAQLIYERNCILQKFNFETNSANLHRTAFLENFDAKNHYYRTIGFNKTKDIFSRSRIGVAEDTLEVEFVSKPNIRISGTPVTISNVRTKIRFFNPLRSLMTPDELRGMFSGTVHSDEVVEDLKNEDFKQFGNKISSKDLRGIVGFSHLLAPGDVSPPFDIFGLKFGDVKGFRDNVNELLFAYAEKNRQEIYNNWNRSLLGNRPTYKFIPIFASLPGDDKQISTLLSEFNKVLPTNYANASRRLNELVKAELTYRTILELAYGEDCLKSFNDPELALIYRALNYGLVPDVREFLTLHPGTLGHRNLLKRIDLAISILRQPSLESQKCSGPYGARAMSKAMKFLNDWVDKGATAERLTPEGLSLWLDAN